MKRMLTAVMVLSIVFACAATAQELTATVPFGFHARDVMLPAGDYTITKPMVQTLMIRHENRHDAVLALARPEIGSGEPRLVFAKYSEDRIFLREVWHAGNGLVLPKTRMERELVTTRLISGGRPTTIVILAARR